MYVCTFIHTVYIHVHCSTCCSTCYSTPVHNDYMYMYVRIIVCMSTVYLFLWHVIILSLRLFLLFLKSETKKYIELVMIALDL